MINAEGSGWARKGGCIGTSGGFTRTHLQPSPHVAEATYVSSEQSSEQSSQKWSQTSRTADGSETDITGEVKLLFETLLASKEWRDGTLPADVVLAIGRLGRACGYASDEATVRRAMAILGIDPGPLWDRPLHPEPRRIPIRPDARTRYESLLDATG